MTQITASNPHPKIAPVLVILGAVFWVLVIGSSAAEAHRDHAQQNVDQSEVSANAPGSRSTSSQREADRGAFDATIPIEQSKPGTISFLFRLVDWLGRTHPMLVHFPLALFPLSLVASIVARRRDEWIIIARAAVFTAGLMAVPAGLFGWFGGGLDFAGDNALLAVHRWLGTLIALFGAFLAVASWRSGTWVNRNSGLFLLLAVNLVLIVQGWYGGALVHGSDHLNF